MLKDRLETKIVSAVIKYFHMARCVVRCLLGLDWLGILGMGLGVDLKLPMLVRHQLVLVIPP